MKRDTTGGPAFPVVFEHMECTSEQMGMNLRDYFAAAALSGGLEQGVEHDMAADPYRKAWWHPPMKLAERAYEIADAMLKARNEK